MLGWSFHGFGRGGSGDSLRSPANQEVPIVKTVLKGVSEERSGCCGRQADILLPSVVSRIHPKDKQDVAHRLILGARSVAYGEVNVTFQGPFPQRITLSAADVVINYDQTLSVTLSNSTFEVQLMAEQ